MTDMFDDNYWINQRADDMQYWLETRQATTLTIASPWSHFLTRVECPQCQAENTLGRVIDVSDWFGFNEQNGWKITNERVKYIKCWGCKRSLNKNNSATLEEVK